MVDDWQLHWCCAVSINDQIVESEIIVMQVHGRDRVADVTDWSETRRPGSKSKIKDAR